MKKLPPEQRVKRALISIYLPAPDRVQFMADRAYITERLNVGAGEAIRLSVAAMADVLRKAEQPQPAKEPEFY